MFTLDSSNHSETLPMKMNWLVEIFPENLLVKLFGVVNSELVSYDCIVFPKIVIVCVDVALPLFSE